MGLFDRLKQGLSKTKANISDNMDQIFNTYGYEKVSEEFLEELEETMIMGDIGVQTTNELLDDLRQKVKDERIKYRRSRTRGSSTAPTAGRSFSSGSGTRSGRARTRMTSKRGLPSS